MKVCPMQALLKISSGLRFSSGCRRIWFGVWQGVMGFSLDETHHGVVGDKLCLVITLLDDTLVNYPCCENWMCVCVNYNILPLTHFSLTDD